MFLDATTRKLQALLGGTVTTNQLPCSVDWVDFTATTTTPGFTPTNTNNTTAVDICAAPGASTQRKINNITIYNADTVPATVTVRYNDNATTYILVKATLAVADSLIFTDVFGWRVVDSTGATKTSAVLANTATVLATPRAIYGNNFDGSAALTQIIASTYGGTGNGFAKFSGPTTSEKTFTLPDASAALTYEGGTIGESTSNTIRGYNKEIFKTATADSPLTATQCAGTIVSNYGMTDADCTITLPPATEGMSFVCILPAVRARFFKLKAGTTDKIYLSGIAGSDNANVGVASGYATGSACSFFTFKASDGNYDWFAIPIFGTWVAS